MISMICRSCGWRFNFESDSLEPNRRKPITKSLFFMNLLLEKYNDYYSMTKFKFSYNISNGAILDFGFMKTSFVHLIGMHKLVDIPIIGRFNNPKDRIVSSRYIISKIKQENMLTDNVIRSSAYYKDIEDRYNNFSRDNIMRITYTDIIIDFDPKYINSKLTAKYILYNYSNGLYNYLAIAEAPNGTYYVESFFATKADSYIKNQKTLKVDSFKILHDSGDVYLEDTF